MERPLLCLVDPDALLDAEPAAWHCRAWEQALMAVCGLQIGWPEDRAGQTDYTLLCQAFEALGIGEWLDADIYQQLVEYALQTWQTCVPEQLDAAVRPRVSACLVKLASSNVAVAPCSGLERELLLTLIERAGLAEYMETAWAAGCGWQSTGPDIFDDARQRAGSGLAWPVEQTVFLGRCPEDIIAARSVGIATIGFQHGALAADYALPSWDALPELLQRMFTS
jgi:beta-phosphoglucomutase-like phosphatase (HAD superfamily)